MSNSIDPDEPSTLDLCCLQKPILSPVAVKELISKAKDYLTKNTTLNAMRATFAKFSVHIVDDVSSYLCL